MTPIKVITSNECIWNRDQVIMDIVRSSDNIIVLDLLQEGPCCRSLQIDNLLDEFVFSKKEVLIETSNQIQSSIYPEKRLGFVELEHCQNLARSSKKTYSTLKNRFGLFIGRSNWKRLGIASHLDKHCMSNTSMTYHFDPKNDYFRNNFGLEEYLYHNWTDKDIWSFLSKLPIKFDEQEYPILWNKTALDLNKQYIDIFCDIVCETFYSGRTFFATEKTWRPIMNHRPFIVQGPQWYLENLKRLGFQTFSNWWSEGYDEDINGGTLESLTATIDYIANQSQDVISNWYKEMQPTLEHNYQTFLKISNRQIISADFKIPE